MHNLSKYDSHLFLRELPDNALIQQKLHIFIQKNYC